MRGVLAFLSILVLSWGGDVFGPLERGDPIPSFKRFLKGKATEVDLYLIKGITEGLEVKVPKYMDFYAEGLVKELRGDLEGAIRSYLRSIELEPRYNPSYFRFNELIRKVKNPEVYREKITKILKKRFEKAPPVVVENPKGKVVFLVEKMSQYLLIYEGKRLKGLYPVTTGEDWGDKWKEGDRRTPEGIYYFTRFIPPERLPKIYGGIAVVLNYPNPVDRLLKKGGSGIWLHGSEEENRNRIPFSTRGCVVANNEDLRTIVKSIKPGNTLIAIYKTIPDKLKTENIKSFLEEWERSWEEKDVERFLSFYSDRFTWKGGGIKEWRDYKRRVIGNKRWIDVKIENLTVLAFRRGLSEEAEYYVAEFRQVYRSDRYSDEGIKRLYIIKEGKKLKILREEFREGG